MSITKAYEMAKKVADIETTRRVELEKSMEGIKQDLIKCLWDPSRHYSVSSWEDRSWGEIKARAAYVRGRMTGEGEVAQWFNKSQKDEIERLWYAMRVIIGDPKLETPRDPATNTDLFGETDVRRMS